MRSFSASRDRRCAPPGARSGSRPSRSRSWDCSRSCAICRACCACCARLRRAFIAARPDVFVGIDAPGYESAPRTPPARGGNPDGPIREPPGVGLAAEPGAAHPRIGRSGAVPPALREAVLRESGRRGGVRRPSARRRHPARPSTVPRRARRSGCPPTGRSIALLPGSRRGEVTRLAEDFAADRRVACPAPPGLAVRGADGDARGAHDLRARRSSALRPRSRCDSSTAGRRPR